MRSMPNDSVGTYLGDATICGGRVVTVEDTSTGEVNPAYIQRSIDGNGNIVIRAEVVTPADLGNHPM